MKGHEVIRWDPNASSSEKILCSRGQRDRAGCKVLAFTHEGLRLHLKKTCALSSWEAQTRGSLGSLAILSNLIGEFCNEKPCLKN